MIPVSKNILRLKPSQGLPLLNQLFIFIVFICKHRKVQGKRLQLTSNRFKICIGTYPGVCPIITKHENIHDGRENVNSIEVIT